MQLALYEKTNEIVNIMNAITKIIKMCEARIKKLNYILYLKVGINNV